MSARLGDVGRAVEVVSVVKHEAAAWMSMDYGSFVLG